LDCLLGEVKRDTPHPLIAVQKAFFCNNAYIPGVAKKRGQEKSEDIAIFADVAGTPANQPGQSSRDALTHGPA
jgi:hypothetical protein